MTPKFKILITCLLILTACSNLDIAHVTTAGSGTGNGIYYALPMTVITVEVPVTEIVLKPGRCFCKDEEMMRMKGEIINELIKARKASKFQDKTWKECDELAFDTTNYTFHKLGDITISSYPVPDSSKIFFVTTRKNMLKKNNLTFALNELGVMQSAEIKTEDRTLDVITQIVGSAASVAGKLLKGTTEKNEEDFCKRLKDQFIALEKSKTTLTQNENSQTEIGTFARQLEEIEKDRQAIIAQFTYVEEKETKTVKIDRLVTSGELARWIDLFTFNKIDGIATLPIPKASYTNLYTNSVGKAVATAEKDLYALRVETYRSQVPYYAGVAPSAIPAPGDWGLAYNIPKKAAVAIAKIKKVTTDKVVDGKPVVTTTVKLIATSNIIMPQFGSVAFLRKNQSLANIELDPFSGALRKVIVEKNAITADQIKNIGTAAESIAGLKKDELSDLQKEASLLEQKEKILKLKFSIDSLAKKQN